MIWSEGEIRLTAVVELLSHWKHPLKLASVVFWGGRPGGVILSRVNEIAVSLASPQVRAAAVRSLPLPAFRIS